MAGREHTKADATTHRLVGLQRWLITAAAAVISICALDSVAAASGGLLAASGVLDHVTRGPLLAVVVLSYALWGAGLRVNLLANWSLLVDTGTSTSLLSKVGFELASARSSSRALCSAAATVGYLITELAKELPYYVAAFGTARYSHAIHATDALAFIAGTNVGAACYELSVAALSRSYLTRRSTERPATQTAM